MPEGPQSLLPEDTRLARADRCLERVSLHTLAHRASIPYMEIRPLTETDAAAIATWRYPGRYATYDVGEVVTHERGFWAIEHEADLVGYCCFGHEARVPGVVEELSLIHILTLPTN